MEGAGTFMTFCVKIITIIAFTLFSRKLLASPQIPDYIIYKGDTIPTYNLLLEAYLQKNDTNTKGMLFGLSFRDDATTNCWRGYQAIYRIENDSLFLTDILESYAFRTNSINKVTSLQRMKALFGNNLINNSVFINWYSGNISFPLSNIVLRWDGVFYKIFEKETVAHVVHGAVTKIENVENYVDHPKGLDRRNKEKIIEILFEQIKKIGLDSKKIYTCSGWYTITIGKAGRVSKVAMPDYRTEEIWDEYWGKDDYNYCIRKIFNAVKKLKFDILRDKGKACTENIYMDLWFDQDSRKIENPRN